MRQVLILPPEHFDEVRRQPGDEVFYGVEAFRFCLEVSCGLHSPLVGETEVYGQFKAAVSAYSVPDLPWGVNLRRFFQAVFEDAKKIRQTHLEDLGSQSYGSVLRRELRGVSEIHILGAGHLVQEILPWIAKDAAELHIHCRNPKKAAPAIRELANVTLQGLQSQLKPLKRGAALIVAAPVSAAYLRAWIGDSASDFGQVLDLRDDSHEDRLPFFAEVLNLRELFARIDGNQARIQARRQAALHDINQIVAQRSRHIEYRPFGWEDVCA